MIVIIDYNMGNLGSISNMCRKIGKPSIVSSKKEDIRSASKLILPGVGSFDNGMKNLVTLDLAEEMRDKVVGQGTPILGICLGMQLMTLSSDEGTSAGLGWIEASARKFEVWKDGLKIPHMGWNTINLKRPCALYDNMYEDCRFYFVHSYYVSCDDEAHVVTTTDYGGAFASTLQKGNIFGVQFHPEKSHKFGMLLLKNFCEIASNA